MRIIIAEDEMLERKAMRKFLEENFHDIEVVGEAANGRQAAKLADEHQPDLMLMDIQMPGMSGLDAMATIYQNHPTTKFIMVTAYDSFDYAKQAISFGVKEYILKPSKKEETIKAIRHVQKEIAEEKETLETKKALFINRLIQGEQAESLKQNLFPNMKSGFFFILSEEQELPETYITLDKIGFYASSQTLDKADVLKQMRKLQLELPGDTYIGIGYPYKQPADLTNSYYEAKQALRHLVQAKKKKYGFPPQVDDDTELDAIWQALENGEQEALWHAFNQHASQITENTGMELYFRIKQLLEEKGRKIPNIELTTLTTPEAWRDFLELASLEVKQSFQSKNKIERAKQYIDEHYQEAISLEDVSAYTDLSPNYFASLFHEATGLTFIEYMTATRLKKAKQLLQQNEWSLKEISAEVGYKDPNYFSRVFKKHTGHSPKQYQNQLLKQ
ncbi:response regulator [Gracilibacillus sp. YIM 98692]|uniref:response regulator n=1 Tax=Gracilibacillus sp. YIM 98692 TaxID=2663532 RepID=UPI0013D6413B|nr:response regulator [Gracilibacillus sp. YIM 98692]